MAYNPPIKINTSMTTMATTPKHYIPPSTSISSNSISNKSTSPRTPYYPNSPVSPTNSSDTNNNILDTSEIQIQNEMSKRGYKPYKSITSTLQGSIWKTTKLNKDFVVKVTKKSLHEKNIAIVNGSEIPIEENIIKETAILRYLSHNNPP
eukprot:1005217_1